MNVRAAIFLLLLCAAAAVQPAAAQNRSSDLSTLRLHLKAEELYQSGHFERAYFIYVNELAAIGDKYSQYMAGYMCLNGQGTRQDPVRASAWYRLAAERDAPQFIEVRDQLLESMSESERLLSDEFYVQLRLEYGDVALALRHLTSERHLLESGAGGAGLGATSRPMTIVDPRSGAPLPGDEYVRRIEKRMQARFDFITASLGLEPVEATMGDGEFRRFSDLVVETLRIVDDR